MLLGLASAHAKPIQFTYTGIGSGTLDGTPFAALAFLTRRRQAA